MQPDRRCDDLAVAVGVTRLVTLHGGWRIAMDGTCIRTSDWLLTWLKHLPDVVMTARTYHTPDNGSLTLKVPRITVIYKRKKLTRRYNVRVLRNGVAIFRGCSKLVVSVTGIILVSLLLNNPCHANDTFGSLSGSVPR